MLLATIVYKSVSGFYHLFRKLRTSAVFFSYFPIKLIVDVLIIILNIVFQVCYFDSMAISIM